MNSCYFNFACSGSGLSPPATFSRSCNIAIKHFIAINSALQAIECFAASSANTPLLAKSQREYRLSAPFQISRRSANMSMFLDVLQENFTFLLLRSVAWLSRSLICACSHAASLPARHMRTSVPGTFRHGWWQRKMAAMPEHGISHAKR
jgi:hypothetical protein